MNSDNVFSTTSNKVVLGTGTDKRYIVLKYQLTNIQSYNNFITWSTTIDSLRNRLMKDIPKSFQKHSILGKKYWNTNSYGGKHTMEEVWDEQEGHKYVSNGEFIFAMLLLGYEMKPYEVKIRQSMFKKEPTIRFYVNFKHCKYKYKNPEKNDFCHVFL